MFPSDASPDEAHLEPLGRFAVRAADALRAVSRAQSLALELDRTRSVLAVVGQATAQLSLAHTLETAVERVAELLAVEQLAVYLRRDRRLFAAAGRGISLSRFNPSGFNRSTAGASASSAYASGWGDRSIGSESRISPARSRIWGARPRSVRPSRSH